MAQYSIKDLEKLSGIQAHTIRIWEKRYRLVIPRRTDTNIRVYSDEDLKRLLNVALLNHNGLKISKIARLNEDSIKQEILNLSSNINNHGNHIDNLIMAMVELNEHTFESTIQTVSEQDGFESAFVHVVYPFLNKIGVLWQTGHINPAQEHFASSLIKQKLFAAIDAIPTNQSSEHKFIIFLPEGEYHELGLLFFHYLIKKSGYYSVYLGQSVPLDDLVTIQQSYHANYLLTSLTTSIQEIAILEYLEKL
jgi:DNA-binding transcriptional MerR regulator